MPSSSSSRLLKGALVPLNADGARQRQIVFQYNPGELFRRLTPRGGGEPPAQTFSCSLLLDATDALERLEENPGGVEHGVDPRLAALELLMYPEPGFAGIWPFSWWSRRRTRAAPVVLFIWGEQRVVPVRVIGLDIRETEHDARLHAIRATVRLRMRVLSDTDLRSQKGGPRYWRDYEARLRELSRLA